MSKSNNFINDRKPKIILMEYITIDNENYRIILINFNISQSTREKIINNYGLNNTIPFNDINKKHIKLTLIPMKNDKVSNIQIIWQGLRERNNAKFITIDQMVYNYNQLNTINIPRIISKSRRSKILNNQSEVLSISSEDLNLFSTPIMDEYKFMNDLMKKSDNKNDDLDHLTQTLLKEDRIKVENDIKEKEEIQKQMIKKREEGNYIKSIFSKIMKEIVSGIPLKKIIMNSKKESMYWTDYELNLLKLQNLMKFSTNMFTHLICKPDVKSLKIQKNKLIHKYSQTNSGDNMRMMKEENKVMGEENKVIKRVRTQNRRPMFYDNQILGLYTVIKNDGLYSMKRYIIKHIESTSDKPEYCFICDVKLIRELFKDFKHHNPLNCLKKIYKFKEYDYDLYRSELKKREMMKKLNLRVN
jgi:hypothetical protein